MKIQPFRKIIVFLYKKNRIQGPQGPEVLKQILIDLTC